eukprot:4847241-Amphidinium_carterae.1
MTRENKSTSRQKKHPRVNHLKTSSKATKPFPCIQRGFTQKSQGSECEMTRSWVLRPDLDNLKRCPHGGRHC